MNLTVLIGLKCIKCGIETGWQEDLYWIDENTYDKRWGLDIFEDWKGLVDGWEAEGWFCNGEYGDQEVDVLCPVCSVKVKEEARKEARKEELKRLQQAKKQKVLDVRKQLMENPEIAQALGITSVPDIKDIKVEEVDDPYDVEGNEEYEAKRKLEVDYIQKWLKSSDKKKNKMMLKEAMEDIAEILDAHPEIQEVDVMELFVK